MIKGIDHVGISVANLERSIAFYREAFGMRVEVDTTFEGERYETILRLRGVQGRVALLKKDGLQVELFEFARPQPAAGDPNYRVCDHRITHFCVQVDALELEYERLKAAGVAFHCPPIEFSGGVKATYGRDPDGNVFELLEVVRA